MTEQNLGEFTSQDQSATPATDNTTTPVTQQPAEKVFYQSDVDKLVGRYRTEGYEKGKRDGLAMQSSVQQPVTQQSNAQVQSPVSNTQQSQEDFRRIAREEANNAVTQQQYNTSLSQFVNQFDSKMAQGRQKYADFADVERTMNLPELAKTNPAFIIGVGQLDNAVEVFRELKNNPSKFSSILQLTSNPATQAFAQQHLNELSASIKQNEAATNEKAPNPPLSQIKTSVTGTDNGSSTIRDARNTYRF